MVEGNEEHEQDAGVLRRWSRRKQGAVGSSQDSTSIEDSQSANEDQSEQAPAAKAEGALTEPLPDINSQADPEINSGATSDELAEPLLTDEDMPDIESIGKDSDVSCFFNRGVSEPLRQRALRHLLRLPAFNITDGLNDYDEDYTTFEPLGDIVTSDMRFHTRRKEKLAAQKREEEEALTAQQAEDLETDETEAAQNTNPEEGVEETTDENGQEELAADSVTAEIDDTPDPESETQLTVENKEQDASVPDNNKPGDLA